MSIIDIEDFDQDLLKTGTKDKLNAINIDPWYPIPANKKWSLNLLIAQIISATLNELYLT
ncbi:MAG: hypothetical protein P8I61_03655 [Opitutae bacterium]|jgi:polyphosphate kinase 2 (PPK2 family)|nr:hypothetical protein [Opitutae bacterium]